MRRRSLDQVAPHDQQSPTRGRTAIDGVLNAAVAVCVCGHGALGAARLVHHGGDLTRRKLVIGGLIVLREDAAGGHYLRLPFQWVGVGGRAALCERQQAPSCNHSTLEEMGRGAEGGEGAMRFPPP